MNRWHKQIAPKGYGFLDFALQYATQAHYGQVRKYTGEDYINHPIAVAKTVAEVFPDIEMIAAAYLHDVVEDCNVSMDSIYNLFGGRVSNIVWGVTDVSKPEDGNRDARKAKDREHNIKACPEAKVIKLADLIDNSKSIITHDPDFSVIYISEKKKILEGFEQVGDVPEYAKCLMTDAWNLISAYENSKLQEALKK